MCAEVGIGIGIGVAGRLLSIPIPMAIATSTGVRWRFIATGQFKKEQVALQEPGGN